jgi:AcrR family transcriptional regulator
MAMRRLGSVQSATRLLILEATQALMLAEGYAAVSARRVAAHAGVKPALVQYYFSSMDELLLETYRHGAARVLERQQEALASDRPLHALWDLAIDPERAALGIEFMALARHRKEIGAEIARLSTHNRQILAEALAALLRDAPYPAAGMSLLLAGISRALVMEQGIGMDLGHAETRAIVAHWLRVLEPEESGRA